MHRAEAWIVHLLCTPMGESHFTSLRNTDRAEDDDSTLRKVLLDVERLVAMLTSDHEQNTYPASSSELVNFTGQQPMMASSLSSTTRTSVTTNEDTGRLIEHLRHRIVRLERERHVLLTSYQLLVNLLR